MHAWVIKTIYATLKRRPVSIATLTGSLLNIKLLVLITFISLTTAPAHAGFFSNLKEMAAGFFSPATNSQSVTPVPSAKAQVAPASPSTIDSAATAVFTGIGKIDLEKEIIQVVINRLNARGNGFRDTRNHYSAEALKVPSISTENHTELKVFYGENGPVLQFSYDDLALKSPEKVILSLAYLAYLTQLNVPNIFTSSTDSPLQKALESPHTIAELLTNAKAGSFSAQARLVQVQIEALEKFKLGYDLDHRVGMKDYVAQVLEQKRQELIELRAKALTYAKTQQKKLDKWKNDFKVQDKLEAQNEKLNDLILNNDRAGVARMLEAYLPWAVMEPSEIQAWKTWIEAIENPDRKNTTIGFRGVDYSTDKIQRKQTANGEVYGFMSTVLTKNQGSYTRRLRSLSTNREKNGDFAVKTSASDILSVTISDQMSSHSIQAQGSNFLSFTYDPQVAIRFAKGSHVEEIKGKSVKIHDGGVLVVEMDSRRLVPNILSYLSTEIELMAPLIIFPDEIVKYHEGAFESTKALQDFVSEITEKTKINFSEFIEYRNQKGYGSPLMDEQYKKDGYGFFKNMNEKAGATLTNFGKSQCAKVF